MRDHLNRIQSGVVRENPRHLADTVLCSIEQEPLRSLRQTVNQDLVVGNTGIDEDDAGGHGLVAL